MKVFLFDIDGTLTPPRKPINSGDVWRFLSWVDKKNGEIYLVSGSDRSKVLQQLPSSILSRIDGLFCSMGNQFWHNEKGLIYSKDWTPPSSLIGELQNYVLNSEYENRKGEHIEYRPGMINFSTVGRLADYKERDAYNNWDSQFMERASICAELRGKYKNLDISVGGQISIDINPRGNNKSQATKWIRENTLELDVEFIFFGDKCHKGGNDYDIVEDIVRNKDGVFYNVSGPEETFEILSSKY